LRLIDNEDHTKSLAERRIELLPHNQLHMQIYNSRSLIGSNESLFETNELKTSLMTNRPFPDGLAVYKKTFTNCNSMLKSNCTKL
jgi:hypothetical protein